MEELKNIHSERYDITGHYLYFKTNNDTYKISQKECLKLVYTLYDSLGLPYTEPDKLADIMEGGGI